MNQGGSTTVLLGVYVGLVLLFLLAPIVVIVLFSFNGSPSLAFPIESLSLQWYDEAIGSEKLRSALQNSLLVGFGTLLVVLPVGTAAAWAIARERIPGRGLIQAGLSAPLAIPGLFIGTALLLLFTRLGVSPSLLTVTVAHILYTLGFYVLVAVQRFSALTVDIEEAASTLGASQWQIRRMITWPLVRPTIIAAAALCLALSLDEFIITFFVVGPESTLPVVIFSSIRTAVTPAINAIATLLLVASWLAVAIAVVASRRRDARRLQVGSTP